jgi:autonomous glycyl radical cofactor GrcA
MRLVALIPLLALAVAGCGGGPKVTQTRDVPTYHELAVAGGVNVDIVPGETEEVVVTGGEDIIDRVRTVVEDGILRVSIKDRGVVIGPDPFDDVRVKVSAAALETIRVQGGADLNLGRIDRDTLTIEVQGGGDISASGTVSDLVVRIAGSGDADLRELEARTARIEVEGSGDVDVNVTDELDVSVQGSGDVTYRGNPRVRQRVEGSGEVRAED